MRLRSLDVFRGLTMAAMVIVNNPGDWNAVYAPLLHAAWHGWTPTDLIFPAFLFIMGASMALGDPARLAPATVLRRGAVLVALGLFLSGFPYFNPARWRIPGVLQRIGVCYVAAVFVWQALASRRDAEATTRRLAGAIAFCLLGYWALIALVAPPGGVAGDLTAEGNLGAWLDRAVFGTHLWKTTWDPEGLLSSWPAVGTTLMGVMAGAWIGRARPLCVAPSLVITGAVALMVGRAWHAVFPINKALWTSSYALATGGAAMLMLGLLHRRLDDGRSTAWLDRLTEPFAILGRNALVLFVVSGLVAKLMIVLTVPGPAGTLVPLQRWLYEAAFAPLGPPKVTSLLYAVATLGMFYGLLVRQHRRRLYWSV
jgi:predicted acyltransferase